MDSDGGGEIDAEEWHTACRDLGYFGPSEPIFRYLDADNEGSVSGDEFEKLEAFRPMEVKRVSHVPRGISRGMDGLSKEWLAHKASGCSTDKSDSRPVSRERLRAGNGLRAKNALTAGPQVVRQAPVG